MFLRLKLMMLGVAGSLALLFAAYAKGRTSQRQQEATKALKNYKNTRERIDEAQSINRSADDARKWLRDRNK
jgi:hypothetical protein